MSNPQECCVLKCGKTKSKDPSSSFFAMPKDECTRVIWLRRAGIDPLGPRLASKKQYVCKNHFDEGDMLNLPLRCMLKRDIVPHKNLPFYKGGIRYGYMVDDEEESLQVGSLSDPDPAPASPPHVEPEPEAPTPITEKCRLCFQTDPKSQLVDIFSPGSARQRRIQQAVSVKVSETDCTTLICRNCTRMVDVIIAFQQICQRSNLALCETSELIGGSWLESTVMIDYLHDTIKQHRQDLFGTESDGAYEEIVAECGLQPEKEGKEQEFTAAVKEESDYLPDVENVDTKPVLKREIEPEESANIEDHDSDELAEVKATDQSKPDPLEDDESPSEDEWHSSEDDEQSDVEPGLARDDQMWQPSESDENDSSSAEEDKPKKVRLGKKSARRKPDPNRWKWAKPTEKIMCDTCADRHTHDV